MPDKVGGGVKFAGQLVHHVFQWWLLVLERAGAVELGAGLALLLAVRRQSGFYTQNGGKSGGGYSYYQNSGGERSYKSK